MQHVLKLSEFTCSLYIQNRFLEVFSYMDLHMLTQILKG